VATTYKVMFWNIQNLYECKTALPAEATASGSGSKVAMDTSIAKVMARTSGTHRNSVVQVINKVNPDILIIVELAVGRVDLRAAGVLTATGIQYDHFGPLQVMIDLNASSAIWQSAISEINAVDIVATQVGAELDVKSKNSMFEQYAVMWREKAFCLPAGAPRAFKAIEKLKTDDAGKTIPFVQRYPGVLELQEIATGQKLTIVMNHSVFGDSDGPRVAAIKNLSNARGLATASPLVVAGDFNVDYGTGADFAPLTAKGLACRIGDQKTCSLSYPPLRNAYDQIFTRGDLSTPPNSLGASYDFSAQLLFDDVALGSLISDHLPVVAAISI
jgi:hypothetical protein